MPQGLIFSDNQRGSPGLREQIPSIICWVVTERVRPGLIPPARHRRDGNVACTSHPLSAGSRRNKLHAQRPSELAQRTVTRKQEPVVERGLG